MGYINSYYNPGPGINKDGKKKKGFFVFFEVLGAKFFKLIGANLLYFVSSLPFFVLAIFILAPQISNGFGLEGILDVIENPDTARTSMYTILACGIINFFGTGPASAGYAFVTRCFSRREHTWIFYDGWNKFKENLKNSSILIVAQRVGTIIDADKIIVLDKGQVVGTGTHEELLQSCDVYKDIVASQLSEEEATK